jgi:hypothetical protein
MTIKYDKDMDEYDNHVSELLKELAKCYEGLPTKITIEIEPSLISAKYTMFLGGEEMKKFIWSAKQDPNKKSDWIKRINERMGLYD